MNKGIEKAQFTMPFPAQLQSGMDQHQKRNKKQCNIRLINQQLIIYQIAHQYSEDTDNTQQNSVSDRIFHNYRFNQAACFLSTRAITAVKNIPIKTFFKKSSIPSLSGEVRGSSSNVFATAGSPSLSTNASLL